MPKLQNYQKSLEYSYAPGLFPSLEAIHKRPKSVQRILISSKLDDTKAINKLRLLCNENNIRIETADRALTRLSGKENIYVAAVFKKQGDELSQDFRHLVLHQPSDKGNLGTMLRTALGFNFKNIAIISPAADYYDPHVVRASMGALFTLNIKSYQNFDSYRLEFNRHTLYPFMLNGSSSLDEIAKRACEPYSLVMGNEATGLPADFSNFGNSVRIEHDKQIDSLNLSVAAGIGMYVFNTFGS
ncbi:MAG: TrmH family RNA methyltransferase [Clostridiales bacterium]|nr:TrmH family RNA methyltransferase [Clostridiales bacterium]